MAKVKNKSTGVNIDLLKQISVGFTTRLSQDEAIPLMTHNPPLIEVNQNDVVDGKALVRLTDEGIKMVNGDVGSASNPVSGVAYEIMTGIGLPPRKRLGRTGGSTSPLAATIGKLEVGDTFFVPGADQVKKLASTISAQNMKYSVETGEHEPKERTKRGPGNKAVLNPDGTKVKETVTVAVRKPTRKFSMRGIKAGQQIETWTAPTDGVLIGREA